jgi:hypothetical protein
MGRGSFVLRDSPAPPSRQELRVAVQKFPARRAPVVNPNEVDPVLGCGANELHLSSVRRSPDSAIRSGAIIRFRPMVDGTRPQHRFRTRRMAELRPAVYLRPTVQLQRTIDEFHFVTLVQWTSVSGIVSQTSTLRNDADVKALNPRYRPTTLPIAASQQLLVENRLAVLTPIGGQSNELPDWSNDGDTRNLDHVAGIS